MSNASPSKWWNDIIAGHIACCNRNVIISCVLVLGNFQFQHSRVSYSRCSPSSLLVAQCSAVPVQCLCLMYVVGSCTSVHVYYREIPAFSKIIINTLATRALCAKCNVIHITSEECRHIASIAVSRLDWSIQIIELIINVVKWRIFYHHYKLLCMRIAHYGFGSKRSRSTNLPANSRIMGARFTEENYFW